MVPFQAPRIPEVLSPVMNPVLSERDRWALESMFKALKRPVTLIAVLHQTSSEKEPLHPLRVILSALQEVAPHWIQVSTLTPTRDQAMLGALGAPSAPAIGFLADGGEPIPIWMVGIPSGYQFGVLIQLLLDLGGPGPKIRRPILNMVRNCSHDIQIQVWVAPTCAHSPRAVRYAQQLALANPVRIHVSSIDWTQVPESERLPGLEWVPYTRIQRDGHPLTDFYGIWPIDKMARVIRFGPHAVTFDGPAAHRTRSTISESEETQSDERDPKN